jgi:hypothetical protein
MSIVGEGLEQLLHVLPEEGVIGDRLFVLLELGLGGELPILEEIGHLEK